MKAIYLNDGALATSGHEAMPEYFGAQGKALEVDEGEGIFAFYPETPTPDDLPIRCSRHELRFVVEEFL